MQNIIIRKQHAQSLKYVILDSIKTKAKSPEIKTMVHNNLNKRDTQTAGRNTT